MVQNVTGGCRLLQAKGPEARGVPKEWAGAHPGEQRTFTKDTIPHIRAAVS